MNFLNRISKNTELSIFMKILLVEAELLYSDRRSDMTKLIVALRNFANTPRNAINNLV